MNTETGEIAHFNKANELIGSNGKLIPKEEYRKFVKIEREPDKDCVKCHGKGYLGRNAATNKLIPCECIGKVDVATNLGSRVFENEIKRVVKERTIREKDEHERQQSQDAIERMRQKYSSEGG